MFTRFLMVAATAWLVGAADDFPDDHVHGSFAFIRTGERTPVVHSSTSRLTALGAQQMLELGSNFRARYINDQQKPAGMGTQQIARMSPNALNNDQLTIKTLNTPYLISSAQAFMQGLYPPANTSGSALSGDIFGISGELANGSTVEFPLGGYQYPSIRAVSTEDPEAVYIAGNENCPMSKRDTMMYYTTDLFKNTRTKNMEFYDTLELPLLDSYFDQHDLDFRNADKIYDLVSYAYNHDQGTRRTLSNNSDVYDRLQYLADEESWYLYGNTSSSLSDIRAMAGKTLASRILDQFRRIIANNGDAVNGESEPMSLFFGEYEPFISLLSLMDVDITTQGDVFRSMPLFGSAMIFELYSTGQIESFPDNEADLWVRFAFHNGTQYENQLVAHPIFGRGLSDTEMPWLEFEEKMNKIMISLPDWCQQCNSPSKFCWGIFDTAVNIDGQRPESEKTSKITPTIAGVIGAIVTLAVGGLLFAVAMLLGGIRFHRVSRGKKSDLGGFKGSAKLASDADLSLPKNAAAPAAGIVSFGRNDPARKHAHERVGSWELRQKESGTGASNTGDLGDESRRESFEAIEAAMGRPIEPTERV